MQQEWQVSRLLSAKPDGERRWESAYQLLWQWSQTTPTNPADAKQEGDDLSPPKRPSFKQEPDHASSPLSSRLDQQSGEKTDN